MKIAIAVEGLDATRAQTLMRPTGLPEGVGLEDLALGGELGAERSGLIVSGVVSLALGVPSGVAANWVWARIAPTEPQAVVTVVVEGKTCRAASAEELGAAFAAALAPQPELPSETGTPEAE